MRGPSLTMSLLLLLLLLGLQGAVVLVRGVNILGCLNTLDSEHYLQAGNYTLGIQQDCNLVLYEGTRTKVWEARKGGSLTGSICYAKLQGDGILALYNRSDDSQIWVSKGATGSGNYLMLDVTGKLSIKQLAKTDQHLYSVAPNESSSGPGFEIPPDQVWTTQSSVIYMLAGYQLPVGNTLNNGGYILALNSSSCTLELRQSNSLLWSSNVSRLSGGEGCHAVELQADGNLQIVGSAGGVAWATNVRRPPSVDSYVLYMDDKGNVSIFNSLQLEEAIWTTHHPGPAEDHASSSMVWIVGVLVGVVIFFVAAGVLLWGLALYYGCCLSEYNVTHGSPFKLNAPFLTRLSHLT